MNLTTWYEKYTKRWCVDISNANFYFFIKINGTFIIIILFFEFLMVVFKIIKNKNLYLKHFNCNSFLIFPNHKLWFGEKLIKCLFFNVLRNCLKLLKIVESHGKINRMIEKMWLSKEKMFLAKFYSVYVKNTELTPENPISNL